MSDDLDFQIVSDDLRQVPPKTKYQPILDKLADGKTVFMPGLTQERAASLYNASRRRGMRLHTKATTIKDVDGIVLWSEPLEEAPTTS